MFQEEYDEIIQSGGEILQMILDCEEALDMENEELFQGTE